MNLGVETGDIDFFKVYVKEVSAFSDESWGGDQQNAHLKAHGYRCFSIL